LSAPNCTEFGPSLSQPLFELETAMSDSNASKSHLANQQTDRVRRRLLGGAAALAGGLALPLARAASAEPEKAALKFGFIKLTDCAPLVIAYEKQFFEDEGLNVTLEAQANWKVLLDRVIDGQLDGAHMLAGQPLGATIGFGTKADVVTAFSMDLNGNGITVSNAVWQEMKPLLPMSGGRPVHPIKADVLKKVVDKRKAQGKPFKMGMVFPVSTHNYELRYWLAAGGLNPGYYTSSDISGTKGADVLLSVTPPPQMPATMEAGTIDGYCVGEPWNQQAVAKGIGVPVITDLEIWKNNPEKVFGVTRGWADKYPNTHVAVVKALIRACQWLDASMANRVEAVKLLAKSQYVGADAEVIGNSMTGTFEYEKGDKRPMPDFNVFFKYYATFPFYSDAIWYLTQMRRWGQITETKPDSWYIETAKKVYLPEVYLQAAKALIKEGKVKETDIPLKTDGFKGPQDGFIDGVVYDGRKPNEYLGKFKIGLKAKDTV
jgi:nitrate/nitrite transport system substrate-binding protein